MPYKVSRQVLLREQEITVEKGQTVYYLYHAPAGEISHSYLLYFVPIAPTGVSVGMPTPGPVPNEPDWTIVEAEITHKMVHTENAGSETHVVMDDKGRVYTRVSHARLHN